MNRAIASYARLPRWARIAAPVAAGIVALGAASGENGDGEPEATAAPATTEAAPAPSLDDAVAAGAVDAPAGLSDAELAAMTSASCVGLDDGASESTAALVSGNLAGAVPAEELAAAAEAVGTAATVLCPDVVAEHPRFLNTLVRLSAPTTTSTTTSTTLPPTTVPPTTTAPPTTAAPPPPHPPPPSPSVHYANCDAARAAGAAPLHRGEPGYRAGLDRDDDGVACE